MYSMLDYLKSSCSLCRAHMCQPGVESENYLSSSVLRALSVRHDGLVPHVGAGAVTVGQPTQNPVAFASQSCLFRSPRHISQLTCLPHSGSSALRSYHLLAFTISLLSSRNYLHKIRAILSFICTWPHPCFLLVFYIGSIRHLYQILSFVQWETCIK